MFKRSHYNLGVFVLELFLLEPYSVYVTLHLYFTRQLDGFLIYKMNLLYQISELR